MDKRMTQLLKLSVVAVILLNSFVLNAQQVFHSLDEIWAYAKENNPDNSVYQLQVEKAVKDQRIANSPLYPTVSAGFSGQHNINIAETPIPGEAVGRPGETEYIKFGLPYVYNGGITVSKTLLDWQSIFQSKIAKSNTQLKQTEKALYEQTLREQVAQIYYATITAQAAVNNAKEDLTLADSILQIAIDRFREGLIDGLSFNQAKINSNNAFDKLEQNKQYLVENQLNLKILLGLSNSETLVLKEQIELNMNNSIEFVPQNEASIKLYEAQIEIAEFERKQALTRFTPKLNFIYYWGGTQYQQDFNLSFNSSDWQPNSYIGLNLSIPIFSGFGNKNQYSSAKIAQNIARLNYEEEIRKSSITDNILFNNYLSSKKLAETANESLKISGENVQLAYSRYSEGLISLDNYLSVYDDYLAVESQYFTRLSDYMINKATILSRNK
ncbi:TolC family protein [uncultured Draconibacterium sp.]|uniref:TolC family protein n=1 Tax=uncultured Draconibacterium sp. TaxID=1573823 RepID=UPI0032607130